MQLIYIERHNNHKHSPASAENTGDTASASQPCSRTSRSSSGARAVNTRWCPLLSYACICMLGPPPGPEWSGVMGLGNEFLGIHGLLSGRFYQCIFCSWDIHTLYQHMQHVPNLVGLNPAATAACE